MVGIWLKWIYQCTVAQQILVKKVKFCTLKVQHDVQVAMAKFCWSVKDCQSQASFNGSTIKGLGPKIWLTRFSLVGGLGGSSITTLSPSIKALTLPTKFPENNRKTIASSLRLCSLHQSLVPLQKFPESNRENNSLLF